MNPSLLAGKAKSRLQGGKRFTVCIRTNKATVQLF